MSEEKKSSSTQNILNVIIVIICGAIMGLFIYDYIHKNDEIAELRKANLQKTETKIKDEAKLDEEKLKKLAKIYQEASHNNTVIKEIIDKDGKPTTVLVNKNPDQQVIADDVSKKLSPILSELEKKQGLTDQKLDKIMGDLLDMLEKENKKSIALRQEMKESIIYERKLEAKLQRNLEETQKVVADMNGLVNELKAKYIDEKKDDSAIGDIIRCASAPAEFVRNTLTFDWFTGRDKKKAEIKYDLKQELILDRYNAIDSPTELNKLKKAQSQYNLKKLRKAEKRIRIREINPTDTKSTTKIAEPEVIR